MTGISARHVTVLLMIPRETPPALPARGLDFLAPSAKDVGMRRKIIEGQDQKPTTTRGFTISPQCLPSDSPHSGGGARTKGAKLRGQVSLKMDTLTPLGSWALARSGRYAQAVMV